MPATQTAAARIAAYIAAPSLDTWKAVRNIVILETSRTLWQAWAAVDGSAPMSGAATTHPDAFTARRAIKAATVGAVPVGLGTLASANARAARVSR